MYIANFMMLLLYNNICKLGCRIVTNFGKTAITKVDYYELVVCEKIRCWHFSPAMVSCAKHTNSGERIQ